MADPRPFCLKAVPALEMMSRDSAAALRQLSTHRGHPVFLEQHLHIDDGDSTLMVAQTALVSAGSAGALERQLLTDIALEDGLALKTALGLVCDTRLEEMVDYLVGRHASDHEHEAEDYSVLIGADVMLIQLRDPFKKIGWAAASAPDEGDLAVDLPEFIDAGLRLHLPADISAHETLRLLRPLAPILDALQTTPEAVHELDGLLLKPEDEPSAGPIVLRIL